MTQDQRDCLLEFLATFMEAGSAAGRDEDSIGRELTHPRPATALALLGLDRIARGLDRIHEDLKYLAEVVEGM